jgi:hypothetical protein
MSETPFEIDRLFDAVARAAREAKEAQKRHDAALAELEKALLLRGVLSQ